MSSTTAHACGGHQEYDLIDPGEYLGNKLLLEAVILYKGSDLGLMNAVLKAVGGHFIPHNVRCAGTSSLNC